MTALLVVGAAMAGAVVALAVSWALRRRSTSPRHRAGPGRPAGPTPLFPAAPASPATERVTAPILSFGTETAK